jgi:hypothetical protein
MTGGEVLLLEILWVRRRFCMLEGGAVGWKECCGWKRVIVVGKEVMWLEMSFFG